MRRAVMRPGQCSRAGAQFLNSCVQKLNTIFLARVLNSTVTDDAIRHGLKAAAPNKARPWQASAGRHDGASPSPVARTVRPATALSATGAAAFRPWHEGTTSSITVELRDGSSVRNAWHKN